MDFRLPIDAYETFIFDMDGVILNSNDLKVNSIRKALSGVNQNLVETFVKRFKSNFGKTRDEHFSDLKNLSYVFNEGLLDIDAIKKSYEDEVKIAYEQCEFCEGFITFFSQVLSLKKNCYVLTGTMESEAIDALKNKGIFSSFLKILGAPKKKGDYLVELITNNQIDPSTTIFFGDSTLDAKAAIANDLDFLFLEKYSLANFTDIDNLKKQHDFPSVGDFRQVSVY